jgi:hypothetical protein
MRTQRLILLVFILRTLPKTSFTFRPKEKNCTKYVLNTPLTSASLGCKRRGAERMDGAVLGACAQRGRGATGVTAEAQSTHRGVVALYSYL